jgi:hypothetical protein
MRVGFGPENNVPLGVILELKLNQPQVNHVHALLKIF